MTARCLPLLFVCDGGSEVISCFCRASLLFLSSCKREKINTDVMDDIFISLLSELVSVFIM